MIGRRFLMALLIIGGPLVAIAEEHTGGLTAEVDLGDKRSLQRGARIFVNYCAGCHAAQFMRFHRLVEDLELPENVVQKNLLFATDKITDTMKTAMRPQDAVQWFGVAPPDLSVVARSRGADWLYSYLMTYYLDPSRPTGVNNLTYPNTAMPDVLWQLQGLQRTVKVGDGHVSLELAIPGTLGEEDFRRTVRDLVNFLVYMGEPAQLTRYRVGAFVLLFLAIFTVLAYLLKKEYWKDVH